MSTVQCYTTVTVYINSCFILLPLVKLITKREVNISAQSLRLPWTRHGILHVIDTHTHHRIYSVTVVVPRPHIKIKQRDLKGGSHMIKMKGGAEGPEPFEFKGGVLGHVDIKEWIGVRETRALLKFLLRNLKSES